MSDAQPIVDQAITIVSGLPRSGTSLLMQMLAAGGHPALTDNRRPPDEDNPRGYFEYAPVRTIERDQSWLPLARGRAIKIVSPLLTSLPASESCRIVFVHRDLDEILRSQARMLERRGEPQGPPDSAMRTFFERHLASITTWLAARPHLKVLNVAHRELLTRPREIVPDIITFLERPLDIEAMIACVDPTLHRQRSAVASEPAP